MSRRNLSGTWAGASQRLTVRVTPQETRALAELADAWGTDTSDALRRAVRDAAAGVREERRTARLAALPGMTVRELRDLAGALGVRGRSKMDRPALLAELRDRLVEPGQ